LQGKSLKKFVRIILEHLIEDNAQLRKLKLSNVILNDAKIVEQLCTIIETMSFVNTLDLSWGSLSSSHMCKIAQSLLKVPNNIMNLNISYNSLSFKEIQSEHYYKSIDFFEVFCQYLATT